MGLFDIFEDIGKAVINVGETVVDGVENVAEGIVDTVVDTGKGVVKGGGEAINMGMKMKGGGKIAEHLGKGGGVLGDITKAFDHGETIADHLRPTRPRKPKGHHNTGRPTQNMEVTAGGSSVPSQPPQKDNRPSTTVDKGAFNGGKSKVTKLFDYEGWKLKHHKEIENIRTYSFDRHPQTVDKAPTLNYYDKASRRAYLEWARAEYAHLKQEEVNAVKELLSENKKKELRIKLKKTCLKENLGDINDESLTVEDLNKQLNKCELRKRKREFDASEKTRKEDVKKSTQSKKQAEDKKTQEAIDKADAVKKANEAGVKREPDDDTAKKILEEIALNKKYPVLSKRVTEYFNENKPSTQRFLEPFFGSVKTRQERLTRDAKSAGISVEKMLETWSGDYVGKLVNDYIKQMLVKEKGKYKWTIPTTPIPANDTVYPYTEKFRKLLLKARRFDERNLPIKYLGMKLADNKFLKTPKVRIGGKAKIAKEDADVKALLDKDAKAVKARKDAKVKETKKFNDMISEKEKRDKLANEQSPENQKKKQFETYATENQKTYPNRNFITDALKSGDSIRYSLDNEKENREYAVDSVLSHIAYSSNIPDKILGNWEHIKDLGTNETKIFYNKNANQVKMAFKGTSKRDEVIGVDFFSILLSHTLTKLTGIDLHYQRAIKKYNEVRSRYPNATFSFTGHSLGGRTAIVVADYEQGMYANKIKRLGDKTKGNNFNALGGKISKGSYKRSHVSGFATGAGFEIFTKQVAKSLANLMKKAGGVKWDKPTVQLYRVDYDPLSFAEFGQSHKAKLYKIPQQTSMKSGGVNCSPHSMLNFLHKDFWSINELKSCGGKTTPSVRGGKKRDLKATPKQSNPSGKQEATQRKPKDDFDDYDKPDV